MAIHPIRTYGDPVLKVRCPEVTEIDAGLVTLVRDMLDTMYDAPGVDLGHLGAAHLQHRVAIGANGVDGH